MNKTAIYTSLFGDYDEWHEPKYVQEGCDYFLFTDQIYLTSDRYLIHLYTSGLIVDNSIINLIETNVNKIY